MSELEFEEFVVLEYPQKEERKHYDEVLGRDIEYCTLDDEMLEEEE